MSRAAAEAWDSGSAYDQFVGRWSRKVAAEFIHWLALPPRLVWADVGCGTGALASTILAGCEPSSVYGIDSSARFISEARRRISDPRYPPRPGRTVPCLPARAAPGVVRASGPEARDGSRHRRSDRLPGLRRLLEPVPRRDWRGPDVSDLCYGRGTAENSGAAQVAACTRTRRSDRVDGSGLGGPGSRLRTRRSP